MQTRSNKGNEMADASDVLKRIKDDDVQFVDLFPAFFDGRDPEAIVDAYYIPGDLHFNETGNARVADAFLESFRPAGPRKPAP